MTKKEIYSGPVAGLFEPRAFRDYMDNLIISDKHKGSQLFFGEANVVQNGYNKYSINIFREYHIVPGNIKLKYSFRKGYEEVEVSLNGGSSAQVKALEKIILQDADRFILNVSKIKAKKSFEKRKGIGKVAFVQRK